MLLFRSLTTGLLGACLLLLVRMGPQPTRCAALPDLPVPSVRAALIATSATIVDVSPAMPAADLARVVQLAPGEHVIAIGEQPVASDFDAGALIGTSGLASGQYLDLTVASAASTRRVLVMMH